MQPAIDLGSLMAWLSHQRRPGDQIEVISTMRSRVEPSRPLNSRPSPTLAKSHRHDPAADCSPSNDQRQ
jgi:hypothetical protein